MRCGRELLVVPQGTEYKVKGECGRWKNMLPQPRFMSAKQAGVRDGGYGGAQDDAAKMGAAVETVGG